MNVRYSDRQILMFIRDYKMQHGGTSPTVREISTAVGITSTSVTAYRLDRLVRRKVLIRRPRGWGFPGERYDPGPFFKLPESESKIDTTG